MATNNYLDFSHLTGVKNTVKTDENKKKHWLEENKSEPFVMKFKHSHLEFEKN